MTSLEIQRGSAITGQARVEVVGTGPIRVVVTHGWATDSTCYGRFAQRVDQSRFTFAFVDARGYGAASTESGHFTMAEVGEDLVAVADELGWRRFSLMGHSMGGLSIQHAFLKAPDRVRSLVGLTPVPASGAPMAGEMLELFRSAVTSAEARRRFFDMSTAQRHDSDWLDRQTTESMATTDSTACRSYLDSWTTTDVSREVAGSVVPSLVVVGEHDPTISKDFVDATWASLYRYLTVEVISGASHYPMIETPDALVATVSRFLATVS